MTQPELPGYYFDTEKKKYFKVQPHHIAPTNAKYARPNVNREQHLAKRQKVKDDHRNNKTVKRARVLNHPLLGGGLHREHGFRSQASSRIQREHAFLSMLNPGPRISHPSVGTTWSSVLHAHWLGDSMAITTAQALYVYPIKDRERNHTTVELASATYRLDPFARIRSTCMTTISGARFMLGCLEGKPANLARENAFLLPIDDHLGLVQRPLHWSLPDSLIDCVANETNNTLAFVGQNSITTSSPASGQTISCHAIQPRTLPCAIEWLDVHTLAYSTHESDKKKSKHTVMLWDVRDPVALKPRFFHPQKITGISKPDSSGNTLIVTSNYNISLYDRRQLKLDQPVLSIPHLSGGPFTYHASHHGSMLAAVDQRQDIQLYSLRSGSHIKTLSLSNDSTKPVRDVRWFEGLEGPFLQACRSDTIYSWKMGA